MEPQQHPLNNPNNWTKPKTWIVPLEVSFMVDDPTKYDSEMQSALNRILNEIRSICANYAKNGGLSIKFLDPLKSEKQIETIRKGTNIDSLQQDALEEMVKKIMEKKKE